MPGEMDGVATLAAIQKLDPKVRALVCSGYDDRPVLNAPQEFGFAEALLKPFEPEDLAQAKKGYRDFKEKRR